MTTLHPEATLRDWFAVEALKKIPMEEIRTFARELNLSAPEAISELAYKVAHAMMECRNQFVEPKKG